MHVSLAGGNATGKDHCFTMMTPKTKPGFLIAEPVTAELNQSDRQQN
jgi:hypothetical protein